MNPNNYPPYQSRPYQPNQHPTHNPFSSITGDQPPNYRDYNQRPQVNIDPNFSQLNRDKMKNGLYSSTMEFNKPAKNFTSLESMGRFVAADGDRIQLNEQKNTALTFNAPRYQKQTMVSSTIFQPQAKQELDRFPSFNLHMGKKATLAKNIETTQPLPQTKEQPTETPEQKRKRQIQAIKLEFEQVSKRVGTLGAPKAFGETNNNQQSTRTNPIPAFLKSKAPQTTHTNGLDFQKKPNNFQTGVSKVDQFQKHSSNQGSSNAQFNPKPNNLYVKGAKTAQQLANTSSSTTSAYESYGMKKESCPPQDAMFKKKNNVCTIDQLFEKTKVPQQCEKKAVTRQNYEEVRMNPTKPMAEKQGREAQGHKFKKSDFVTVKKLGKGQFGQVMLVQHKITGFVCGMKVMQKKQIRQQKYDNQIARELSIQFYLAHRNIAPLYGYFSDEDNVYLLLEFCPDGQLLQKLRKDRRMEEEDTSVIIRQILEGIDYIHKEFIIHRDIKPENILFNQGVVKICDFGWAVYRGQGTRKTASGSPLYYSPEIVNGDEYDEKIDIWDIGMMTYQCLIGKIPFKIYSELDLKRIVTDEVQFPDYVDVTEEAKDFILKTLKKKPEDRLEIREMLRHPFISKYKDKRLPINIMEDITKALNG